MRFAGVSMVALTMAALGCAGQKPAVSTAAPKPPAAVVAGVWDGVLRATITEGIGTGDTRIEKQEWHLPQTGAAIAGYYVAALTFVSGDGRPYVCSRQPQFSAIQRFDVTGRVREGAGQIDLEEVTQQSAQGRCDPGNRRLFRYEGTVRGDVLTLVNGQRHQTLYRSRGTEARRESVPLPSALPGPAGPT